MTHQGNSVINGTQLGFSLTREQVEERIKNFKSMEVGYQFTDEEGKRRKRPVSESFTGRFFSLDKVFGIGDTSGANVACVHDYHNIDSWEGLRDYLGSDHRIYRHNTLLTGKTFNRIGEDIEEE